MDTIFIVVLIILIHVVFVTATIFGFSWHFSKSRALVEKWANENGFKILHVTHHSSAPLKYFWFTSSSQVIYHVKISDSNNAVRSGWVRCGGYFLGVMTDRAEVRWEDKK